MHAVQCTHTNKLQNVLNLKGVDKLYIWDTVKGNWIKRKSFLFFIVLKDILHVLGEIVINSLTQLWIL